MEERDVTPLFSIIQPPYSLSYLFSLELEPTFWSKDFDSQLLPSPLYTLTAWAGAMPTVTMASLKQTS